MGPKNEIVLRMDGGTPAGRPRIVIDDDLGYPTSVQLADGSIFTVILPQHVRQQLLCGRNVLDTARQLSPLQMEAAGKLLLAEDVHRSVMRNSSVVPVRGLLLRNSSTVASSWSVGQVHDVAEEVGRRPIIAAVKNCDLYD